MRLLADLAAQRDHLPKRDLEACEQRAADARMGREDQVQEMLAVGAALNRRAVLRRHGLEQVRPDIGEIRHGAVGPARRGRTRTDGC